MSQAVVSDNTSDHRYINNFLTKGVGGGGGAKKNKVKKTLKGGYPHANIFCSSDK